jgi:hypothetical protein
MTSFPKKNGAQLSDQEFEEEISRGRKYKKRNGLYETESGYLYRNINGKKVREHRRIMEEVLGRPLMDHELVHHKNGDRKDNRPENLELWSHSQPCGQRVKDKVAWAIELLTLYAPERLSEAR